MHLAGGGVNRDILEISIYGKGLEYSFKYAHVTPFPKTAVYCLPRTIPFRKFSPRCTSSGNPQHPIQCCAVITFCRASAFSFLGVLWRQQILDALPLAIRKFISFRSHMHSLHNCIRLFNFYFQTGPKLETTKIYAHADTEHKRKAIEASTPQDNPLYSKLNSARYTVTDEETLKKLTGLK